MMTPGRTPRPGRDLGHPVLGRRPGRTERDHVARHRRRAGRGAGHDRAVLEAIEDRVGQQRPADRRRQPQLVAAGQEDPGLGAILSINIFMVKPNKSPPSEYLYLLIMVLSVS